MSTQLGSYIAKHRPKDPRACGYAGILHICCMYSETTPQCLPYLDVISSDRYLK